jgi:hypothetical protein
LKPAEIITALKSKEPSLLGDIPEKKAEQILKAALTLIRETVVGAEPGDVAIGMLGRFKVAEVTKGEGAEATKHRRVVFVPPKPVEKDAPGKPAEKAQAAAVEKAEKAEKKAAKAKA